MVTQLSFSSCGERVLAMSWDLSDSMNFWKARRCSYLGPFLQRPVAYRRSKVKIILTSRTPLIYRGRQSVTSQTLWGQMIRVQGRVSIGYSGFLSSALQLHHCTGNMQVDWVWPPWVHLISQVRRIETWEVTSDTWATQHPLKATFKKSSIPKH